MKKLLERILGTTKRPTPPKITREYLRNKILGCTTPEQMESAMKYVQLSGYCTDAITQEWLNFKNEIENI